MEWQRACIDVGFCKTLDRGALDPALVSALPQQTLVLDATARVTVLEPGLQWQIRDTVNEYTLLVVNDGAGAASLQVLDGGVGYQLYGFDYSRIRYYPEFERRAAFNDGHRQLFPLPCSFTS